MAGICHLFLSQIEQKQVGDKSINQSEEEEETNLISNIFYFK